MTRGRHAKDLTGQRFGRLTALESTGEKNKWGSYLWLCQCDCGNRTMVSATNFGRTQSCGCILSEVATIKAKTSIAYCEYRQQDYKEGTCLHLLNNNPRKNNTSGVKGVHWDKRQKVWLADLFFQGKRVVHKSFKHKDDAIACRKEAEERYFKPMLEKYGKGDG
jgi:hypothetical protein